MTNPDPADHDRRSFLATGVRCLVIGGFAAFVLAQENKRRRLALDPACLRLDSCADCIEFGGCGKPRAVVFRESSPDAIRRHEPGGPVAR